MKRSRLGAKDGSGESPDLPDPVDASGGAIDEQDTMPEGLTPWEKRQQRLMRATIREAFADVGIDMQERFELRKDNAFTRRLRLGSENLGTKVVATTIGALITGAVAFLGMLLKDYFHR